MAPPRERPPAPGDITDRPLGRRPLPTQRDEEPGEPADIHVQTLQHAVEASEWLAHISAKVEWIATQYEHARETEKEVRHDLKVLRTRYDEIRRQVSAVQDSLDRHNDINAASWAAVKERDESQTDQQAKLLVELAAMQGRLAKVEPVLSQLGADRRREHRQLAKGGAIGGGIAATVVAIIAGVLRALWPHLFGGAG